MKYYLDTEFLEGTQAKRFLGFNVGQHKPTIDFISIGLVDENDREYYAISKDFNLKEAWNRYDLKYKIVDAGRDKAWVKEYWIRDNVLLPIFKELHLRECEETISIGYTNIFNYQSFKLLINLYGKTNRQIANEICAFIYGGEDDLSGLSPLELAQQYEINDKSKEPEFYTYYGAYDWVAFCWLFGKMIDLPKGFPMYSRDLKQILDEKAQSKDWYYGRDIWNNLPNRGSDLQKGDYPASLQQKIDKIKRHDDFPKQENEHNALADAHWNKKLHEFLLRL